MDVIGPSWQRGEKYRGPQTMQELFFIFLRLQEFTLVFYPGFTFLYCLWVLHTEDETAFTIIG